MRAELRFPDPSANPYLAFTVMLAAAMHGVDQQLSCPEPLNNVNVYQLTAEERKTRQIEELPGSLAEAMRALEKDEILKDALGPVIYEAFTRAKWAEIEEYRMKVTDWELDRYLEQA